MRKLRKPEIKKSPSRLFFSDELKSIRIEATHNTLEKLNKTQTPFRRFNTKLPDSAHKFAYQVAETFHNVPLQDLFDRLKKGKKKFKLLFPSKFAVYDHTLQDVLLKLTTPFGTFLTFRSGYRELPRFWYKGPLSRLRRKNIEVFKLTYFSVSSIAANQEGVVIPMSFRRSRGVVGLHEVTRYKLVRRINIVSYERGIMQEVKRMAFQRAKDRFDVSIKHLEILRHNLRKFRVRKLRTFGKKYFY